ncbi:TetR/AcrR family transcriptional regulator [Methylibium sp.]|uniref:TetR/AcrR family transcriptional regulator n=1 Tax=Methylibium sp. TaxID=2067992 RepID=UPI003D0D9847
MKAQRNAAGRGNGPPADGPSRKDLTHDRIVGTAARAICRSGYDGTGVADIMKEAGLTHGGFYAHFPSRTALLAEAADRAGADSTERLRRVVEGLPAAKALDALVDHYLSDAHLKATELGCPLAALACDTPRQAPEVRAAVTQRLNETLDLVAQLLPGRSKADARTQAMAVLSCLVGAMALARAADDPKLSRALRRACRQSLQQRLG